jgi:hypothetical protein
VATGSLLRGCELDYHTGERAFGTMSGWYSLSGDTEQFLERVTKVQWGLMITVYCIATRRRCYC